MNYVSLDRKAIGLRLYHLFADSPYTYAEISENLGLTTPQVFYDWFEGDKLPGTERLVNIALFFGTTLESILL